MKNFRDQVIWITGASSGIGEGMAYAFAERGAKLILSSRKKHELERVKSQCKAGTEVMVLPLDVLETDKMPDLAQQVIDRFGRIDLLFNNAGVSQRSYIKDTDLSVDERLMKINYLGNVGMTKAVLPYMRQQKSGHIVVISSVLGKFGVPMRSGYAASKHALHGYYDSMRVEVAQDNIEVTLICPGYVQSNVTINALKGDGSKNAKVTVANSKGMTPAQFAEKAISIIRSNKKEVVIAGKEKYLIFFKGISHSLYQKIVSKIKFEE